MTPEHKIRKVWFPRSKVPTFDSIYAEYAVRLYRFSHRLCGNATDAEDLTQEVFLAAYQNLSRFEGRSSLATWLFRIALYRWHARKRGNSLDTVALEETTPGATTPDLSAAQVERWSLDTALEALPDNWREAFLLVKAEGLTCREAAAVLEIPEGTLKFHVSQAVNRLRYLLQSEESGSGIVPQAPVAPAKGRTL